MTGPELVDMFDKTGQFVKTAERKTVFGELEKNGQLPSSVTHSVPVIHVWLMNSKGELLAVQRANLMILPFMWDRSVGGHVSTGQTFDEAAIRELSEELGVIGKIVPMEEFDRVVQKTDLKKEAVLRRLDFDPWRIVQVIYRDGGRKWWKAERDMIYLGRFDGDVHFADGEANASKWCSVVDLKKWVEKNPNAFLSDTLDHLNRYEKVFFHLANW